MGPKTVIIHGWSDQSESFVGIKKFLGDNGYSVDSIYYGDWLSREDQVTYDDVVMALNQRFYEKGFIDAQNKALVDLNVIVHSTGGLIIRHWISKYYFGSDDAASLADMDRCPVKNIVMLAPANFGSPLAEMGKSWIGGIVKGTHELNLNFFSTGKKILNGLELGSEYQWKLAHQDLLRSYPYFTSKGIQVTVLVGMAGFGGMEGFFTDKPGSDGTVVISGANLESVKFSLVPPALFDESQNQSSWKYLEPPLQVAYAVLPGLNHGTITKAENVGSFLLEALKAGADADRPGAFLAFRRRLSDMTNDAYLKSVTAKPCQQFLVHVQDDQFEGIDDFTVEFLIVRQSGFQALVQGTRSLGIDEKQVSIYFQKAMTSDVNTYSQDGSYRSFIVDVESVDASVQKAWEMFQETPVLAFRVYVPDVDDHVYYDLRSLQIVALNAAEKHVGISGQTSDLQPQFIHPNTTTLVEVNVRRSTKDAVWVDLVPHDHP